MIDRREALRWSLGLSLLAASGAVFKSLLWPAPISAAESLALRAYATIFLPPAGMSAEAMAELVQDLVAAADTDRSLRRVLRRGMAWLEARAGESGAADYAAMAPDLAARVLPAAASAAPGSVPRVFYERLRWELFRRYYARPQTLAALKLSGPPQPLGFPDYTRAP